MMAAGHVDIPAGRPCQSPARNPVRNTLCATPCRSSYSCDPGLANPLLRPPTRFSGIPGRSCSCSYRDGERDEDWDGEGVRQSAKNRSAIR
ncbi:hypothetical protein GCM10007164_12890 [Luteimonas padinae]|nr:hypothetical protein GCM10007164_12890 [Luteimonas padinae]